jgi:hypothetical protein
MKCKRKMPKNIEKSTFFGIYIELDFGYEF